MVHSPVGGVAGITSPRDQRARYRAGATPQPCQRWYSETSSSSASGKGRPVRFGRRRPPSLRSGRGIRCSAGSRRDAARGEHGRGAAARRRDSRPSRRRLAGRPGPCGDGTARLSRLPSRLRGCCGSAHGRGAGARAGFRRRGRAARQTSVASIPSMSRRVRTWRCPSGSCGRHSFTRCAILPASMRSSIASAHGSGGRFHAPEGPKRPSRASSGPSGAFRGSRAPAVRARLMRMRKIQVFTEDRPSKRSMPRTTPSHVSWTTSSATARLGTKDSANRSSLVW